MKDTIIEYQANTIGSYTTNARITGHKEYEIKDHLGNVRAVISDVKNPINMAMPISNWTFTAEIRNLNNYYPYGMELPGGGYASIGDYGYGYNGMEKDDEFKKSLYATLFREGDTKRGTWWKRDPLEMSMPFQSPYIMMDANPISKTDIYGDKAWDIKNEWDEKFIEGFNNYVKVAGLLHYRQKSEFTCEDFVVNLALVYAASNNLPFKFHTGLKYFDASSVEYNNFNEFKYDLLDATGAPELQDNNNTYKTGLSSASTGTLIVNRNDKSVATHIQMIIETSKPLLSLDFTMLILQGNQTAGTSNPRPEYSWIYCGMDVQVAIYKPNLDIFFNYSTDSFYENFSIKKNIEFRRFNFMGMNNYGKDNANSEKKPESKAKETKNESKSKPSKGD